MRLFYDFQTLWNRGIFFFNQNFHSSTFRKLLKKAGKFFVFFQIFPQILLLNKKAGKFKFSILRYLESFFKKAGKFKFSTNLLLFSAFDDLFFPSLRIASDFATSPNPGYSYAQPRGWWPPLAFHGKTSSE